MLFRSHIETNECKFKYFSNLFIYLFGINNLDIKIKKIYFELSHTLSSISFANESFALIEEMHKRYPDDIVVLFTYAKLSIMLSYKVKYENAIREMKELSNSTEEQKKKSIIDNYLAYASTFESIGKNDYEKAKNTLVSLRNQSSNNPLIENNIALINVMTNKIDEGYSELINIVDKFEMYIIDISKKFSIEKHLTKLNSIAHHIKDYIYKLKNKIGRAHV